MTQVLSHLDIQDAGDRPLVVIALDGGNGSLIGRWAAEGVLPTFAGLMRRGCFGDVAGADSKIDHGLFTSLWSGVSRGAHGYYHFRQLDPGAYRIRERTGVDFDAPPFWAALKGRSVQVAIIDAPETQPIEGLQGIQLSDWAVHEPRHPPQAIPPALLAQAGRSFGAREVIAQFPLNTADQDRKLLSRYLDRIRRKGRMVRDLLGDKRFGLTVVGFGEMHTAGHQFWDYLDKSEYGDLADGVRSIYAAVDRELEDILAKAGPDANVVVFSSVGIADSYPTDCVLETLLEQLDYLVRPPPSQRRPPLDALRNAIPRSWRKAISFHFPRKLQERLVADGFTANTDWSRTTAFNIPATHNSSIRINLRGREPNGIVEPGDEYEALIDRISRDMLALTDAVDGQPLVADLMRPKDLFGAGHHPDLPDIFINWRSSKRFFGQVKHGNRQWSVEPPNWFRSSYHHDLGWFAAAGPSIGARGQVEPIDGIDLAPLFLSLLGVRQDARADEGRRRSA